MAEPQQYTDAQLADGTTLRFLGTLGPDEVRTKVAAFRLRRPDLSAPPSAAQGAVGQVMGTAKPGATSPQAAASMQSGPEGLEADPNKPAHMYAGFPGAQPMNRAVTGKDLIPGAIAGGAAATVAGGTLALPFMRAHPVITQMLASEGISQARKVPYVGKYIPPYSEWLPFLIGGGHGKPGPEAPSNPGAPFPEAPPPEAALARGAQPYKDASAGLGEIPAQPRPLPEAFQDRPKPLRGPVGSVDNPFQKPEPTAPEPTREPPPLPEAFNPRRKPLKGPAGSADNPFQGEAPPVAPRQAPPLPEAFSPPVKRAPAVPGTADAPFKSENPLPWMRGQETPVEPEPQAPRPQVKPQAVQSQIERGLGNEPLNLKPNVRLRDQLPFTKTQSPSIPEGHTPVESSALQSYKYDPNKKELEVTFQGGAHHAYAGVEPEQAAAFEAADSKGKAFAQIKNAPGVTHVRKNGKAVIPASPSSYDPNDLTDILTRSIAAAK